MQTVKIARKEWIRALNEFTRVHEGRLVSLDILAESIGAQPEFHELPLIGLTAEPSEGGSISITSRTRSIRQHKCRSSRRRRERRSPSRSNQPMARRLFFDSGPSVCPKLWMASLDRKGEERSAPSCGGRRTPGRARRLVTTL
jgi:hypothetical protein